MYMTCVAARMIDLVYIMSKVTEDLGFLEMLT